MSLPTYLLLSGGWGCVATRRAETCDETSSSSGSNNPEKGTEALSEGPAVYKSSNIEGFLIGICSIGIVPPVVTDKPLHILNEEKGDLPTYLQHRIVM